ncbi:MAG: T9SS type A sorting domain-containing protein [Flavobacteriales bacterium]|nr:T9SS type A sorting domain-containing protein [Flavobacteriales bacterium]
MRIKFSFSGFNVLKMTVRTWFTMALCYGWMIVYSQSVGTSPLEYNPETFFHTYKSMIDEGTAKNIYPLGSYNYYIHDTLALPFIDDFSTWTFKNYDQWSLGTPVDSVAPLYRITPLPPTFPFNYRLEQTYTYSIVSTSPVVIDSIPNISYQYILYGDPLNPFIPVDTLSIWPVTTRRYFFNELTSTIDSSVVFPDGVVTDDSTRTYKVYFPVSTDKSLWVDNFAYRNFSMGIDPPTMGVVTLDGTNEFGRAYVPGGISSFGINDYLTSKPINLAYPASDSIYLSFFYQPQGLGYAPAAKDSLVLEFYDVDTRTWHHVLNIPGGTAHPFKQVLVPIKDSKFLKKGFQFRFKNWGNRSGNLDHWNLDYVRLDRNRNHADTLIHDVAFVFPPFSILRRYREMPYTQFTQSEVDAKWENYMANLSNMNKNICYKFIFSDENGNILNRYTEDYTPVSTDTNIIAPYTVAGYASYSRFIQPDFNYNFQSQGWLPLPDSTRFFVKNYIINFDTDVRAENDTFLLEQKFFSHFAYDDGTAEEAIWLGTQGSMALKFNLNFPDTLRAIQFYFSPVREDESNRFIDIKVWSNLTNDASGEVYSENRQIRILPNDPKAYINPVNNGYSTYILDEPVPLPAGEFYVGWHQNQTFKIHLGFDKNTNNKQYTFYKTTNQWDTLSFNGTIMIRPIVGPAITKQQIGINEPEENVHQLLVYPNPASDLINYKYTHPEHIDQIVLYDITGKQVLKTSPNGMFQINVNGISPGVYFIHFYLKSNPAGITSKVIIH